METNHVFLRVLEQPKPVVYVRGRIRRVEGSFANPNLTPKQKADISQYANLTRPTIFLGNPIAIYLSEKLIEITDRFMPKESTTE